jgi:hypothetical protein
MEVRNQWNGTNLRYSNGANLLQPLSQAQYVQHVPS